eukprot:jgi/Botrbrau1/20392/Bobra.0006s0053.1
MALLDMDVDFGVDIDFSSAFSVEKALSLGICSLSGNLDFLAMESVPATLGDTTIFDKQVNGASAKHFSLGDGFCVKESCQESESDPQWTKPKLSGEQSHLSTTTDGIDVSTKMSTEVLDGSLKSDLSGRPGHLVPRGHVAGSTALDSSKNTCGLVPQGLGAAPDMRGIMTGMGATFKPTFDQLAAHTGSTHTITTPSFWCKPTSVWYFHPQQIGGSGFSPSPLCGSGFSFCNGGLFRAT